MAQAADLPGAAHLELVDGVVHLDPKPAMLEAMLVGWVRQQQTRFLNEEGTIKPRVALVRRLVEFTNAYHWEWGPADAEALIAKLRSSSGRKPIAMSTGRGYEITLTLFMGYLTDRRYGWAEVCLERFGDIPQQIFHEDNRVAQVVDYEGRPGRRSLTYDEVQALFDAADGRAEATRARPQGCTHRDAGRGPAKDCLCVWAPPERSLRTRPSGSAAQSKGAAVWPMWGPSRPFRQGFQRQPAQAPDSLDGSRDGLDHRRA